MNTLLRTSFCALWTLIVVLAAACSEPSGKPEAEIANKADSATADAQVSIFIDFGNGTTSAFTGIDWQRNMSVWDAMAIALERWEGSLSVAYKEYEFGKLITAIDGVGLDNSSGKFWTLCVNGMKSNQGVSEKILAPDDEIRWLYTDNENPCPKE